jgi:hypothetical protein
MGKGKRLRLAVESDRQFEWGHLQLNLIDDATGASCNDHFTIWNHKSAIEVPSVHRLVIYVLNST